MAKKNKKLFEDDVDLDSENIEMAILSTDVGDNDMTAELELAKSNELDKLVNKIESAPIENESLDKVLLNKADKPDKSKQRYKKSKKNSNNIFLKTIDETEQNNKVDDEDEWEDEEDLSKLEPYDAFVKTLDSKLARIEDGEISEIITFDKNMEPILKYNYSSLVLRELNYLRPGDIILHNTRYNKYSVRRVIKIVDDDIFVLGDTEHRYTIIKKNNILAKVVAKIDGTKFVSFNSRSKIKKYAKSKIHSSRLRTLGRVIQASDEDLAYIDSQEKIKRLAAEKEILEKEALKVQNDKMTAVDDDAIKTFATSVDETAGLKEEYDVSNNIAIEQAQRIAEIHEGFQTNITTSELPDDIAFGLEPTAAKSQITEDNNFTNATGFTTKTEAKETFDINQFIDKPKKKKKNKKDDEIENSELPTQSFDTLFSTSISNEDDILFGKQKDEKEESIYKNTVKSNVAPEKEKETEIIDFDDDLPPIDFSK